ncbi:MAG: hypothetical protein K6F71_03295 [Ruminococcus sp.]|uniref:hypothetical protein n=1 Tax=Ruminococcus sp. TaxID=41978 RepID=UPI0025EC741D|nr:hypothetical protein [Ruminococcus sp.]MCR5539850.1 hypothetical protein [Ruminococcus sp.]
MKRFYVINDGEVVFGPASKARSELEAENMREEAVRKKLEEWGYDPDDCSEKRLMEAALAVGYDGELFEVEPEDNGNEYLDNEE